MGVPKWALTDDRAGGGRVFKSASINVSSGLVRFVASLATAVILGRILTPDDFGLVAMVMPILALAMVFSDSGISTYTLQLKKVEEDELNHSFWLGAFSAVVLFVLFLLFAPLIVHFYQEDRLKMVTLVLAFSFLLTIFTAQHNALTKRCFRQDLYAIAEIAASISSVIAAVALALAGFGYWALVAIPLARHATHGIIIWYLTGWIPGVPKFNLEKSKLIMGFGMYVLISQSISVFGKNIDKVLIGWKLGTEAVGYYNMAFSIMMLPFIQVLSPVGGAIVPYFSQIIHAKGDLKKAIENVLIGLGVVVAPAMLWASLKSEHLLIFVLGDKWLPAAKIFSMLALTSISMSFGTALGWTLIAAGNPRVLASWSVFATLSLAAFCFAGLPWGGFGVSVALLVNTILLSVIFIFYLTRYIDISPLAILSTIFKVLLCSAAPVAIVIGVEYLVKIPYENHLLHLLVSFIITMMTFPVFFYLLYRSEMAFLVGAIRKRFSRRAQS